MKWRILGIPISKKTAQIIGWGMFICCLSFPIGIMFEHPEMTNTQLLINFWLYYLIDIVGLIFAFNLIERSK